MGVQKHNTITLATDQLEVALLLWFEENDCNLSSIITLAGAVEELLGKQCKTMGRPTALDESKNAFQMITKILHGEEADGRVMATRANHARNAMKHHANETYTSDLTEESKDMLERAIQNYITIKGFPTLIMEKFLRR